jgi:hypothetical protein
VQGIQGPTAVSANAGNIATLGTDNLILVPQSVLWNQRMRSFNALGNSTFEVDQRNINAQISNIAQAQFLCDRWWKGGSGTYQVKGGAAVAGAGLLWPGTNYRISGNYLSVVLTTAQATMSGTDLLCIRQYIEGTRLRELISDVHSLQLLVSSSVAPFSFTVALTDNASAYSFVHLCTIQTPNVWTLVTIPNIPVWTASGTFPITPGSNGYILSITLDSGPNLLAPAADVWNAGDFRMAAGQSHFCNNPINSTYFQIGFIQHEPGPICTGPIDLPFNQNLDESLRYFDKGYSYGTAIGSVTGVQTIMWYGNTSPLLSWVYGWVPFKKPLAKAPTMTIYDSNNGAVNSVYSYPDAIHRALASPGATANLNAISQLNLNAVPTAGNLWMMGNYVADTGW